MTPKPFNLEAALNGAKLVTRDGREVKQFTFFECQDEYPCVAVINDTKNGFTKDGRWLDNRSNSVYDLFLAPQTREGWINIYPGGATSPIRVSKEESDRDSNGDRIACIRVEWEE